MNKENVLPNEYARKLRFAFYVLKDKIHGVVNATKDRIEITAGRSIKTSDKIIGGILIVVFLFLFYIVLDANKYAATLRVIDGQGRVGVNPLPDSLDFGDLSRGTSAIRKVDLSNGTAMPMYVVIVKTGTFSDLVAVSENNFKLLPQTKRKIEFAAYVPASAEIDKIYNGRVYLFKIPTFGL
ncbi:MAG: hypothetical protein HZB09_00435 [Candidatus Yonathbacteria bacterium]|nr:hypothetical protein [Candidatus Yonathbacteria bacterium]